MGLPLVDVTEYGEYEAFLAAVLSGVDLPTFLTGLMKARLEAEGEFENEEVVEKILLKQSENNNPASLLVTYARGEIKRESEIILDNSVYANQKEWPCVQREA